MNKFLHFVNGINSNWISFWGALIGALISGIFAILVFSIDKHSENQKQNKELLNFGELYCTSINVMQESYVDKQISFMDEFIQEIEKTKYNPHRLKTVDASDYLDRIAQINIQDLSKLYVLLNRDIKNLVIVVNHLDFLKNQLQNYVSDASNSLNESYKDSNQIFAIYSGVWSSNSKLPHPSTIQDIIQVEVILKEQGYNKKIVSQIQTYRQRIETRNEVLLGSYSNVKNQLILINNALLAEIKSLKELIETK